MSTSGTRRTRRSAAQWDALLAEQVGSGLTQETFCRLRGLGYSTFGVWRARLRRSAAGRVKRTSVAPRAAFIELPPVLPEPTRVDSTLHVELELGGGMVLRIGRR